MRRVLAFFYLGQADGSMGENADVQMAGNPFEPYVESLRQQLEEQDPVFLVGVIVALAAVVVTFGEELESLLFEPRLAC